MKLHHWILLLLVAVAAVLIFKSIDRPEADAPATNAVSQTLETSASAPPPVASPSPVSSPSPTPDLATVDQPIDTPDVNKLREEVGRDPHSTPPSLLAFAQKMAAPMEA